MHPISLALLAITSIPLSAGFAALTHSMPIVAGAGLTVASAGLVAPLPELAPVSSRIAEPRIGDQARHAYTETEKQRVRDWLQSVYAAVRSTPGLDPVEGFYAGMYMNVGDSMGQPSGSPLRGVLGVMLTQPIKDGNTGGFKPGRDSASLDILLNGVHGALSRLDTGPGGSEVYAWPEIVGEIGGFPVLAKGQHQYVVISRHGNDLVRPAPDWEGGVVLRPELAAPRERLQVIVVKMNNPGVRDVSDRVRYLSHVRSRLDMAALYELLD